MFSAAARRDIYHEFARLCGTFRCPICMSLMKDAKSPPCHHFACADCWEKLLRVDDMSKKESHCPVCKKKITKRQIRENDQYRLLISKLHEGVTAFGYELSDGVLTDPASPPKPVPRYHIPLKPKPYRSTEASAHLTGPGVVSNQGEIPASLSRTLPLQPCRQPQQTQSNVSQLLSEAEEHLLDPRLPAQSSDRQPPPAPHPSRKRQRLASIVPLNQPFSAVTKRRQLQHSQQQRQQQQRGRPIKRRSAPASVTIRKEDPRPHASPARSRQFDGVLSRGKAGAIVVGDTVEVAPRTWPGINKLGGVAFVTAVYPDASCDIKYILGGSEARVSGIYIQPASLLQPSERQSRRSSLPRASGGPPGPCIEGRRDTSLGNKRPHDNECPSPLGHAESCGREQRLSAKHGRTEAQGRFQEGEKQSMDKENVGRMGGKEPKARNLSRPSLKERQALQSRLHAIREGSSGMIILLPTKVGNVMQEKLRDFVELFDILVVETLDTSITHVVTRAGGPHRRAASRTIKLLYGILQGAWCVSAEWVADSLRLGQLQREAAYELTGDPKATDPFGPKRARLAREKHEPPLFTDYTLLLVGDFPPPRPNRRELELLILAGNGSLESPQDSMSQPTVVICNSSLSIVYHSLANLPLTPKGQCAWPIVTSDWLLDSISTYRIKETWSYAIK